MGFDHYLLCVCEAMSFSTPKVLRITNYPPAWLNVYDERGLMKLDPIRKYCATHIVPVLWTDLDSTDNQLSDEEREVMTLAANHGLSTGLSVPASAPSGQTAYFSLASSKIDFSDQNLQTVLFASHTFMQYLLEAYLRIDVEENPKVAQLTDRELECVFWACEGKTAWEMSQIVGITERTINFHLTSVIKKLGASNRQHAVAKAVLYGLVTPTL
jgi:DNA-binding HTH domain-containing proteins